MSSTLATVLTRRRGRHRWTHPVRHGAVSLAIAGGVPLVLFASCHTSSPAPTPSTSTRPTPSLTRPLPGVPVATGAPGGPSRGHAVVYRASAPGRVTVVYPTLGTVATEAGAVSPWSHQATVPDDDMGLVTLAAGNPQNLAGPVTCTILVDGRVAVTRTATGPYASVLCTLAVAP